MALDFSNQLWPKLNHRFAIRKNVFNSIVCKKIVIRTSPVFRIFHGAQSYYLNYSL